MGVLLFFYTYSRPGAGIHSFDVQWVRVSRLVNTTMKTKKGMHGACHFSSKIFEASKAFILVNLCLISHKNLMCTSIFLTIYSLFFAKQLLRLLIRS
ncbi:hypothetical protein DXT99_06175 [Pontibacter diazotrophicus]|uniref:Uncharacterized protein n=1 Tax=Pontibacter diazotrophicus TaxID=1400979 RepID=A0A3D8LFU3_9BACT|nr:hypothetical protein DXT99_06175 [Pontibacter diazotrophicus]